MLTSWKFWSVMAFITGLVGLLAFGFTRDPKVVESPLVGKAAPPFAVTEMNTGAPLSLEALRGTPFMINFWASWCQACREEAPYLKAAYDRYEKAGRKFRVIGIAIQDTLEDARRFARLHQKEFYLALDNKQGDVSLNWGLYGVPETFFVDARGIITHKHIGALTWPVVESEIERLLAAPAGGPAPQPPAAR
ncbi:MAG: redoxin domain-containing protein [Candidatus Lambdaproteobacteria bacterium]|nr:redoxin domain-containing protein [Candidatus Lambdaproteobacteria bacterium]